MWHELRVAVRVLRRSPGFSVLAVLTLALGIALATAMCAVLNGTLWHPLPFPEARRIVAIGGAVSRAAFLDWQQSARSFEALAGYRGRPYTLSGTGTAASLKVTVASGSLFTVLRANAEVGRTLSPQDDASGARVAVLSHAAWRDLFESDRSAVGRTISLNRADFAIVGVMPAWFQFPTNAARVDIYTTLAGDLQTDRQQAARGRPADLQVVGRLKAGVDLQQARAEISAIGHRADEPRASASKRSVLPVVPLADQLSVTLVSPLTVLAWAVACVLFVSCMTVAVLMLIRVARRRGELSTRFAVGASPGDIARLFLIETLIIALGGAALGAALAIAAARPLLLAAGPDVRAVARAEFDAGALGLAVLASVATVLLVGIVPAVQAGGVRWPDLLREGGTRPRTATRLGHALLIAEIALTVTLLAVCLTLLHTYATLSRVNPGFDLDRVMTFRIDLSDALYTQPQQAGFFDRVKAEAARVHGVQSTAFAALLPFGDLRYTMRLDRAGASGADQEPVSIEVHIVSPDFFRTMGIPLLRGRDFDAQDQPGRRKVAVVSREMARRWFGDADPIGRTVEAGIGPPDPAGRDLLIVGVVGDVRNGSLASPTDPQVYVPYAQAPFIPSVTFVARLASPSSRDTAAVVAEARGRVAALDRFVPLVDVKPLDGLVKATLVQQRFNTLIAGIFAVAAVVLTMAGLYAVVSYSAMRRRKEFAVRLAVGARRQTIAWLVLKEGVFVIVPGVGLGVGAAAAARRASASVLYGVQPNEIGVLALAALLSTAVALIAISQPAHSATRQDLRSLLGDQV
jgi:putative ABC transport system permease protein